jgi:dienelactone hydrolase
MLPAHAAGSVAVERRLAMKYSKWIGLLPLGLMTVFVAAAGAAPAGTKIDFASLDTRHPYKVSGTLYLPENAASPVPAVVLVHGTLGIDQRGELYRQPEPDTFLPMAFAALKALRKLPTVDPTRIGMMGFSLGGNIGLRTAMESNVKQWMGDEKGFVAFALFYPVCNHFTKDFEKSGSKLTGGPMIIFYGTDDSYGEGNAVPELKSLLAAKYDFQLTTVEYPGATHAFNLNGSDMNYLDPAAKGMRVHIRWNAEAANDSVTKVVAFLRENLVAK